MARWTGNVGTVTVGASVIGATEWGFTPTNSAPDVTGMDSGGYGTHMVGLNRATLSVTGFWDGTGKPPSIQTGTAVTFSLAASTATDNPITLAGAAIVTSSPITVVIDGGIAISIEATVTGDSATAAWTETAGYVTAT